MAELTPQDLGFAETAPVRVDGTAVLDVTPAEVWAVIVDYRRWPQWFPNVKTCVATSDPPTGVGSTRRVTLPGGASIDERFIAWEPEELWAFTAETARPPVFRSLVERITITEIEPGRTSVAYRMAFDPHPVLKPAGPLLRVAIGKNLTRAMHALGEEIGRRR